MPQNANTALERQQQAPMNVVPMNQPNAIAKINMRELRDLAGLFMESGAFPDIKSAAQAMVKIYAGQELGFSPIVSMTGIHFFQGKVAIGANLIASLIKDSGKYVYKIPDHTSERCTVVFYELINGEAKQLGVPVTYTIADAKKAGLDGKDTWKKYPADMLFAACMRQGARRYCADILRGTVSEADMPMDDAIAGQEIETAAEPETVDAEPAIDADESRAADLLAAIGEGFKEKLGGDVDEIAKFLRGGDLSTMPVAALEEVYERLQTL